MLFPATVGEFFKLHHHLAVKSNNTKQQTHYIRQTDAGTLCVWTNYISKANLDDFISRQGVNKIHVNVWLMDSWYVTSQSI
jgi:hypothetical protein